MDIRHKKRLVNEKARREFIAGFVAGLVCLGTAALALLIIVIL